MNKKKDDSCCLTEVVFNTPYGPRKRVNGIKFDMPSLTKQSFKDECDINNIIKKFNATGQLPDLIMKNPLYGDFSNVPNYQEACEIVSRAESSFSMLDAKLRKRFQNDPAQFLDFINDPENLEESYDLGLRVRPKSETPVGDPHSLATGFLSKVDGVAVGNQESTNQAERGSSK